MKHDIVSCQHWCKSTRLSHLPVMGASLQSTQVTHSELALKLQSYKYYGKFVLIRFSNLILRFCFLGKSDQAIIKSLILWNFEGNL